MTAPAAPRTSTRLTWITGDSWDSADDGDEWAVLIHGQPVNLTLDDWSARAQARARADTEQVLATWATGTTDPATTGQVVIGSADVVVDAEGTTVTTSTVRLAHSAMTSRAWGPLVGEFDLELTRTAAGEVVERYTIVRGTARAEQDVTR